MRKNGTKHLLSFFTLTLFLFLAASSTKKTLNCGAFDSRAPYGKEKDKRTLVILNDGTEIEGRKAGTQSGLLFRDGVKMDGKLYKVDEVKGYQDEGKYYLRIKKFFAERVVDGKGKTSVYMHQYTTTSTNHGPNGRMSHNTTVRCDYYVQQGDREPRQIRTQEDIADIVAGCPKALDRVQVKNKAMRKNIRANRRYLNEVFEMYNACK